MNISNEKIKKEGYVYLIQRSSEYKSNSNMFKIGKTSQKSPVDRFRSYDPGLRVWMVVHVPDCTTTEKRLIRVFSNKYEKVHGKETFICNKDTVYETFLDIVQKSLSRGRKDKVIQLLKGCDYSDFLFIKFERGKVYICIKGSEIDPVFLGDENSGFKKTSKALLTLYVLQTGVYTNRVNIVDIDSIIEVDNIPEVYTKDELDKIVIDKTQTLTEHNSELTKYNRILLEREQRITIAYNEANLKITELNKRYGVEVYNLRGRLNTEVNKNRDLEAALDVSRQHVAKNRRGCFSRCWRALFGR